MQSQTADKAAMHPAAGTLLDLRSLGLIVAKEVDDNLTNDLEKRLELQWLNNRGSKDLKMRASGPPHAQNQSKGMPDLLLSFVSSNLCPSLEILVSSGKSRTPTRNANWHFGPSYWHISHQSQIVTDKMPPDLQVSVIPLRSSNCTED